LPAKLIVAHSDPTFREILSTIFQQIESLELVAKAATAAELLQAITTHQPEIIVTDVALSGMEGFTLGRLAIACRKVKVIISWQYQDEAVMPAAFSARYAGYLVHHASPPDYHTAISEIMKGHVFYCCCSQRYRSLQNTADWPDAAIQEILKEKYLRLAYCIQLNFTNKETALAMELSKDTVDTYRKIFNKALGSQSRTAIENFIRKYELYKR